VTTPFEWGFSERGAAAAAMASGWEAYRREAAMRILSARRAERVHAGTHTAARLRAVGDALEHNLRTIHALLEPVLAEAAGTDVPPPTRSARDAPIAMFERHLRYVFRDWAWGRAELMPILALVGQHWERHSIRSGVVLGAGAMRLPFELAQSIRGVCVTAVDRNPVFCALMARLQSGGSVDLWEIPDEPRDLASVAVRHTLALPEPPPWSPLRVILGDVREWEPGTPIDCLVTPFILDVAGSDALALIDRWSRWLRPGGWWVHIGPLSFRRPWLEHGYTIEEIRSAFRARGLVIESANRYEWPYLSSPYDSRVSGFSAHVLVARRVVSD
jgi:hypothetical protein